MDLILESGRSEKHYWRDLWHYRELFFILAWRDVAVRYKQTVIGVLWAVIRPFVTVVIFTVVFGHFGKTEAPPGLPYSLIVMAAILPWQFFATALSESSNSLINNSNLISKIYFPRMIVPAGSVITSFVDFLITLGLMGCMMIWDGFAPDLHLLALPLFTLLAFAASFGIGLWLCALNVEYRDFRTIVPFIVQFGLYVSPVGFTISWVPAKWQLLYSLNPMVGVIDGFRWSLLRGYTDQHPVNGQVVGDPLSLSAVAMSVGVTLVLCLSGIWYFRKMERTFADVI
jgi:lipopolysaccharide transport system permease protein